MNNIILIIIIIIILVFFFFSFPYFYLYLCYSLIGDASEFIFANFFLEKIELVHGLKFVFILYDVIGGYGFKARF